LDGLQGSQGPVPRPARADAGEGGRGAARGRAGRDPGGLTGAADDLGPLRPRLLDLHRQLLEAERVDLERYGGRLTGAEFLQIASDSFRLAWLRPLSELIVAIDETLDAREEAAESPEALVARARALVAPPDEGTPFGRRYLTMLQVSPAVVMAHAALVGALPPRPSG
jgi:hypothetical protein